MGTLCFVGMNRFVLFLAHFVFSASHVSFCGLYLQQVKEPGSVFTVHLGVMELK